MSFLGVAFLRDDSPMTVDHKQNSLLGMMPDIVIERIARYLMAVQVNAGDVLYDTGESLSDVYFPLDAVVSLDLVVTDHLAKVAGSVGVALTGNEGVVGLEPFFGSDTSATRATVRIQGSIVVLSADTLVEEFSRAGVFHRLLLRFSDALFAQLAGVAACERVHPVYQRLVRWLLLCQDRSPSRDLELTQEALSNLLGVRRTSISAAARQLHDEGLIAYRRGRITILDQVGLESKSCQCYREIKARYLSYHSPD